MDSWIWSVRLARTRSAASVACRAGHVRVNGVRVKPAHAVRAGDEVRLRHEGRERVVVVSRVITRRVGAPVAAECYIDNSPPPPPRDTYAVSTPAGPTNAGASGARYAAGGIGILVIPVVLMLLFRKKYPRWWYDWNLQLTRFSNRIAVYHRRAVCRDRRLVRGAVHRPLPTLAV